MPGLNFRDENGTADLTPEQVDQNWASLFRELTSVTVSSGVLALSGQGRYAVGAEGGAATDEVTSVTGLPSGRVAILYGVSGQVVTFMNGTNLRLQGNSYTLETEFTTLVLRSKNGTQLFQEGGLYVG